MTLVLRKLLASSTFAIAEALDTISRRLTDKLGDLPADELLEDELDQDFEALDGIEEEWSEDDDGQHLNVSDRIAIQRELVDLKAFRDLALSITHNAKGDALLIALETAFAQADNLGAERKAIIFTESRRTQEYLLRILDKSPFSEGIVLFNGSNNDERSKRIYAAWLIEHEGTDRITGSRPVDMRSALVDYFREQGQIMIATEAGAEGINLQFCSLVVNYDLPWNPQWIEQRIGRCHRYGQKHDVVVVNFINQNNAADQRVFELLAEKFSLFEGVFGASDEVLGAIESGVDFEKRIAKIYQCCRTQDEIDASFDQLQSELSVQINQTMTQTRQQLLENFDEEVHEKLRVNLRNSKNYLNRYEQMLIALTQHELSEHAQFADDSSFTLLQNPYKPSVQIPLGRYELPRRSGESHYYRLGHPLAAQVLEAAKSRNLPSVEVLFDYTGHPTRISVIDPLVGKKGALVASLLTVESLGQAEDHLLVCAVTDDGVQIEEEQAKRLLTVSARVSGQSDSLPKNGSLDTAIEERKEAILRQVSERNAAFFEAEANKIDGWANDLKVGLEREIMEFDRQIKEARRSAVSALTLEEKLEVQKQIRHLEGQRNTKRRALFEAQDEIDSKREMLITEIEDKLQRQTKLIRLFSFRWKVG